MNSYFFVPASKIYKIQDLEKLGVDEFIIDFEDAIDSSKREFFFKEVSDLDSAKEHYIRVPLHKIDEPNKLDLSLIKAFQSSGFSKYVFPKINSIFELNKILDELKEFSFKFILLVESPKLYLELLSMTFEKDERLVGIGLGSHDFIATVGGAHELKNLEVLRQNILYLARAMKIIAVDIASMEINKETDFVNEVFDGHAKGYDAKFIIHPKQHMKLKKIQFYTEEEYLFALKVEEVLPDIRSIKEFSPVIVDGKIIEQPHLRKIQLILKNYRQ